MKQIIIIWAIFLLSIGNVFAQNKITGIVQDAHTSQPLEGVSLVAVKSDTRAISSSDGRFSISVAGPEDSLWISFIGYSTKKVAIGKGQSIKISMSPLPSVLSELVVTGSERAVKRTEVPVAITPISAEMLKEAKPQTLDQVLNKVSGVYMVDLGNEQHMMAIRQPVTTKSNFLYLEDGIPIRTLGDFNHNAMIEINQASIERIEVVKGPSSSLYGSDAIGGAVNVITLKTPEQLEARAQLEGTTDGYKRVNLSAGNSWGKTGLIVSGNYTNRRHGVQPNSDFDKYAFTARWDQQLDKRNSLTALLTSVQYETDAGGSLDSAQFFSKKYHSFYTFNDRTTKAWRGRVSWKHDGGEKWNSRMTFYYRHNDVGQNPAYRVKTTDNPLKASGEVNSNIFSSYGLQGQYFRRMAKWDTRILAGFQAETSPTHLLAHYIDIDRNAEGFFTGFTETDSVLTDYEVDIYNAAGFVRLQTSPVERLRFVLGLRYDFLYYDYANFLPPSAFSGAPDGTNNFSQFSPKLGLTYDFGKDRGLYANYSVGFSPPDIGELYRGVKIPSLQSARYFNYEAGGWIAFDHHKGYLDANVYRMDGRNEIISYRLPDGSSENRNAGKTQHYGVEYTLEYNPISELKIRISGTNVKHRFIDYVESGKDYSKNQMDEAPQWIANAQLTYYPAFIQGLSASMEWQHLSKYYMDPANTKTYPGYHLFNLRVNYQVKQFELWSQLLNVFDTNYATRAEKSAYAVTYSPGIPLTFVLGAGYHFKAKKK